MTSADNASSCSTMRSHHRIAILTDGYSSAFVAKTAISLLRYRTPDIVAVIDRTATSRTAQAFLSAGGDIPVVPNVAAITDVDAIYVGIAPPGGKMPDEWRPAIVDALQRGIDIVSGLHDFLNDDAQYLSLAKQSGAKLIDVRRNHQNTIATCYRFRRENIRIHSVGHDCTIGKMVTTLEIQRALETAGQDAKFLATGQTGMMISAEGVPVDCVVADFVNGAVEELVKQNEQHDFLLIEGQGSISHPAFSAVTLGLLHGCAPDGLIFCYEAGRQQVKGLDEIDIPPPLDQMHAYEVAANLRHPCQFIGIAVNTRYLTPTEAETELRRAEDAFGLPACDVYRTGADKLVQACLELREKVLGK